MENLFYNGMQYQGLGCWEEAAKKLYLIHIITGEGAIQN